MRQGDRTGTRALAQPMSTTVCDLARGTWLRSRAPAPTLTAVIACANCREPRRVRVERREEVVRRPSPRSAARPSAGPRSAAPEADTGGRSPSPACRRRRRAWPGRGTVRSPACCVATVLALEHAERDQRVEEVASRCAGAGPSRSRSASASSGPSASAVNSPARPRSAASSSPRSRAQLHDRVRAQLRGMLSRCAVWSSLIDAPQSEQSNPPPNLQPRSHGGNGRRASTCVARPGPSAACRVGL